MPDSNHSVFADSAALYVAGALPDDERRAFEAHLRDCATCAADVRSLGAVVRALPEALPQIDPPATLRARVLSAVPRSSAAAAVGAPRKLSSSRPVLNNTTAGWLGAAALLIVALGASIYAVATRQRLSTVESQLRDVLVRLAQTEQRAASASREAASIQARLAVLTSSDLAEVNLAGQPPAPAATGRAFLSRSRGLVFAASNLPALPAGKTYQLWYLTGAAPVSAGLFKPDAAGRAIVTLDPPATAPAASGLAVSIEPEGGVPAPTGAILLAGQTH
jgi:anti-sigma-K factor RskA